MGPIPYGRQDITEADIEAVVKVLKDDYLTQGPRIAAFEKEFASYVGAPYAVAVSNGTAALHLCALALGVDTSSRVITSPITFAASANCIRYCGGTVELADIDPETYVLDPVAVRKKLEAAPKGTYQGIVPVDLTGMPADLLAFRELADEFGLWLLEDACHAPGGGFTDGEGRVWRCGDGKLADLAIFSFHPVKHIASGEGGMITTSDEALYQKLQRLRTHGITKDPDLLQENHGGWYYEMHELGYNYRLTDIQSALGRSQLQLADQRLSRRQAIAARYDAAFGGMDQLSLQIIPPGVVHAYHLYVIRTQARKALYDYLREHQIYTQVHYIPIHFLPYYQAQGLKKGDYPHAEAYYSECLSLPMFPTLSNEKQDYVIERVKAFFE